MWQLYVRLLVAFSAGFLVGFILCAALAQDRLAGGRERRRP